MDEKIRKLTPAMLKRIIAEEKQKLSILKERKKYQKKSSIKKIKVLKETKKLQRQLVRKFKKLYLLRESVKKSLKK